MYDIVKNPIPKNNLFVTPQSLDEVMQFIMAMPERERAQAMTAVSFALNWAHNAVETNILSKEVFAQ
jgi:hypothetical protein